MNAKRVERHIDALDGIRAVAIIFVAWFHIWQQTWLTPYINFNNSITKYLGITEIPLAKYVRYGFDFVDLLILLSAVCNFYPYAKAIVLKEKWPSAKEFYYKRAIRIVPSYVLSVIVLFVVAVFENRYAGAGGMGKDLFFQLTFTGILSEEAMLKTQINCVLWTAQLEVIYYIFVPWIAKAFKKVPGITTVLLWLCSILSINLIVIHQGEGMNAFYVNHILTFAAFYATGMLIAIIYVYVKAYDLDNKYIHGAALILLVASVSGLNKLFGGYGDAVQLWQLQTRLPRLLVFSGLILGVMLGYRPVRFLFGNKLMRFISVISYNLYIWHQVIAVKLKQYRIPYWEGDTPPNMLGDTAWQWKYQWLIIIDVLLVSVLLTYFFEIPFAKYFRNKLRIHKEKSIIMEENKMEEQQ